jgi:hypothetical protein
MTRRRAELRTSEDALTGATWQAKGKNETVSRDGWETPSEWQKAMVELLRHQILLLAMKNGRAPLPVSPALWRGLQRQGFLSDAYDLGSIARRLLFLGDGRMLLAELRIRAGARPALEEESPKQMEIAGEDSLQLKEGR